MIKKVLQGRRHRGVECPLFCVAKRKMGDKGKKERVSKQKLLKGCHQVVHPVRPVGEV